MAFSNDNRDEVEIINAGGGGIQIIRPDKSFFLVPFGISDLNRQFSLNSENPAERKSAACTSFIKENLPKDLGTFVYTGGEKTYLTKAGATLGDKGECLKEEFLRISRGILAKNAAEMEALSPFGKNWMLGAVASNCIVEAALEASGTNAFYPSDRNIAHGLVNQLMEAKHG